MQSCKETSWPLRHPIPFQSHSRAVTLQHKNIVWTKNKEVGFDPIFSKLPGKTSPERQPFCTSSCSHSTGSACPRGMAELLHPSWNLKVKTLPWDHSASIPGPVSLSTLCRPADTQHRALLPAQMGQEWAKHSTCYLSQLTSR